MMTQDQTRISQASTINARYDDTLMAEINKLIWDRATYVLYKRIIYPKVINIPNKKIITCIFQDVALMPLLSNIIHL